jgi:hypothetical protein
LGANISLKAQFSETIASGRPGNANGTNSVGKGVYQAQIGYNFATSSLSGEDLIGELPDYREFQGADAMFRIGLREDFELRIFTNAFGLDRSKYENDQDIERSGLERLTLGFRQSLTEQKGFWPAFCVQFAVDFGGIGQYQSQNPDPILRLNFSNRISEKFVINYNVANRWNVDESNLQGFYIVNLGYALSEKFTIATEGFGFIRGDGNVINGGIGLAYLLNDDFQLDMYGSYGTNHFEDFQSEQALLSLTAGISYRIVSR